MGNLWMGVRGLFYGGRERGQTLAEYALILLLIAMVIIGTLTVLGTQLDQTFVTIRTTLFP